MNKKYELIANIILITLGISAGTVFYITELKDLSLVFFSIALASILYQFLGGIGENNNFNLGAIKFGGAAAILIGFMFFLKKVAFVPNPEEFQLQVSELNWIPISAETGKVINLKISNGKDSLLFPDEDYKNQRKQHHLSLIDKDNKHYNIVLPGENKEYVGTIDISDFNTSTLFNEVKIDNDELRLQIFSLYPNDSTMKCSSKNIDNIELPFEIEVFKNCRFNVKIQDSIILKNKEIIPKTAYIIPISNKNSYILFLEQAVNKTDTSHPKCYSKWLAKRIYQDIE